MTRRSGKAPSQRQLRVGEEIRHALAELVARADFRDPALMNASISITEVRVSPDLRNATVFVSDLKGENHQLVVEGLNRASGHIRHEYSRVATTKFIPKFNFRYDDTLDEAWKINKLLQDPKVQADLRQDEEE